MKLFITHALHETKKKLFQGQVLDTIEATNEVDCWYQCTIHDGCQWYSYGLGSCLFFNDCPSLNEDLEDYISGQVECQFGSSTVPTTSTTSSPVTKSGKKLEILVTPVLVEKKVDYFLQSSKIQFEIRKRSKQIQ